MTTRVDVLTTFPRPAKAANEEFVRAQAPKVDSGWDAYQVWLTRIKTLQEAPRRPTRHG
jgi:hypothetical protein